MAVYSGIAIDLGGFLANQDMDAFQYHLVKTGSAANEVALVSASTDSFLGVLQNDPNLGQEAVVRHLGTSKVMAVATSPISYGDSLTMNASARAIKKSASGVVVGIALEALSSGSGYIQMLVLPFGARYPA